MGVAATIVVCAGMMPVSAGAEEQAPARLPFPSDARYAYVDPVRVFAESRDGQTANQQLQQLVQQKQQELGGRQQELQASQQQLQQNASVMSPEAQLALQQEINRIGLEVERMTQDAEAELAQLEQQLQLAFQTKFTPAVNQVATSMGLHLVFNASAGGLFWAEPALDISADVVAELNRAGGE
jgi:Skp family chaperone for outer membrane proteins